MNMKRQIETTPLPIRKQGRKRIGRVIVYLLLIAGSAVMLFPFAWLLRSSVMSTGKFSHTHRNGFRIRFCGEITRKHSQLFLFFTLFVQHITNRILDLSGTMITCSLAAFSFSRLRWPGRNLIFGIILTALMLPYAVTLIPHFIIWQNLGAINTILPLTVPAWLGTHVFAIFLLRQFFYVHPKGA